MNQQIFECNICKSKNIYLPDDIPSKNSEKSKKCYDCGECNFETKKRKGRKTCKKE